MSPKEEIADFRRRFPDPRPIILARLAEHSVVCKCQRCLEAYAENVGPVAQGHRLADALEEALKKHG